jgi:acetolactate synthase-1/2/3 large subunit
MRGADAVLRTLEDEGVRVCFGMPGGAILPIYDAIARGTSVRHVLVRHEQGAGHMAQGYARASGKPGVVFATSGPGATNLITPIADAAMDSTPLVCITGQVRSTLIGTDAFQECPIVSVAAPLVKSARQVRDAQALPHVLREAFDIATSGRPGPVLVDIPRDVQESGLEFAWSKTSSPGAIAAEALDPVAIATAAELICEARSPILYVGGGAQRGRGPEQVRRLAELMRIPVVTTLLGKGSFPETHELAFGCPGMHGSKWANWALNKADLVLAVGARFDDRVTGRVDDFAPDAKVVHFEADPKQINKIRRADVPVRGDLAISVGQVVSTLESHPNALPRSEDWVKKLAGWRERFPLRYDRRSPNLKPQAVLEELRDLAGQLADVSWTTGVGQHQMWAMQYLVCDRPGSFITSGGHGTMGFGLPAAIGAKAARPSSTVICVDGDGSFQMTAQEIATSVAEGLPVIVVIINNGYLGMVEQWQSIFYEDRLSEVDLTNSMPDYAAVARGYGALGYTVESLPQLQAALVEALERGQTAVLDVHVDPGEPCYPMIPPNTAAVDVLEWPGST